VNRSLRRLTARKQVLLAELQLQRMQLSLYAGDARAALRPAGLIGGAIARPAAAIALVDGIARLLGWHRLARVVRLGAIALVVFRFARAWQSRA
jgi:hypothetical protein